MTRDGLAEERTGTRTHWQEWHDAYDDQGSSLSKRLRVVQRELGIALDECPDGPLRIVSLCAGDARDVLGVVPRHRRRDDVELVLVELDDGLLASARHRAHEIGLDRMTAVLADAGATANYAWSLPADVLLACGIFGNVSAEDLARSVMVFAAMVRTGGSVLWTRHRRPPDLTPTIRGWFVDAGFEERSFTAIEGTGAAVGHDVLREPPASSDLPARLFHFVGDGSGAHF